MSDGKTQAVSVFGVGIVGDRWVGIGSNGRHWCQSGCVDYGHGSLSGMPGHYTVSLAPDRFDETGAVLDSVGLLADLVGQRWVRTVANAVSTTSDLVSLGRTWAETGTTLFNKDASFADKVSALEGLAVDLWGLKRSFAPDIVSLGMNFANSTEVDKQ